MRYSVILFNLGCPDFKKKSIKRFLFNLFYDECILRIKNPFRCLLAIYISIRRCEYTYEIYNKLNGGSPLLSITNSQAGLLERYLNNISSDEYKVFTCMRYWNPLSKDVTIDVKKYNPDEIIFLPLYPQFSTTTTYSSIIDWNNSCKKNGLNFKTRNICCYYDDINIINFYAEKIIKQVSYNDVKNSRFLFSAHSLPKNIIKDGDPYQYQIIYMSYKIIEIIMKKFDVLDIDWNICYQSKVGRLEWLKPSTECEIMRCKNNDRDIVLVPISFVSENSETLYELDIEYKELLLNSNIKFNRIKTFDCDDNFILFLRDLCLRKKCNGSINCKKYNKRCFNNCF